MLRKHGTQLGLNQCLHCTIKVNTIWSISLARHFGDLSKLVKHELINLLGSLFGEDRASNQPLVGRALLLYHARKKEPAWAVRFFGERLSKLIPSASTCNRSAPLLTLDIQRMILKQCIHRVPHKDRFTAKSRRPACIRRFPTNMGASGRNYRRKRK